MYAQGTDLSKLPFTDTLQPNPLFNPQANAQKNDQQFGKNQWAYSTSQQPAAPKPSGGMDMSIYSPGKAQPTQTPSLGTAYGQPSTQGSPQQKNPFASMQPGVYSPSGFTPGSNFQQPLATALAQRDAFVQQANQALLPYQVANFTNQNFGPPQFDIAGMRKQANQMVQDGFYNPFAKYFAEQDALNQIGMQAPPSLYGPPSSGPQSPAPPMQADPYQQWLATLPGYQTRDQWMTKQPPVSKSPSGDSFPILLAPNPADPRGDWTAPSQPPQWRAEDYEWQNPLTGEVASNPAETTAVRYSPDPNKTLTDRGRYDFYAGKAREDGWIERRKAGASGQPVQPQPKVAPRRGPEFADPATGKPVFRTEDGTLMWTPGLLQVMEPYDPAGQRPPILLSPESRPGQAQPKQPPSQGTPYGVQPQQKIQSAAPSSQKPPSLLQGRKADWEALGRPTHFAVDGAGFNSQADALNYERWLNSLPKEALSATPKKPGGRKAEWEELGRPVFFASDGAGFTTPADAAFYERWLDSTKGYIRR
jgi:hypothetical protein